MCPHHLYQIDRGSLFYRRMIQWAETKIALKSLFQRVKLLNHFQSWAAQIKFIKLETLLILGSHKLLSLILEFNNILNSLLMILNSTIPNITTLNNIMRKEKMNITMKSMMMKKSNTWLRSSREPPTGNRLVLRWRPFPRKYCLVWIITPRVTTSTSSEFLLKSLHQPSLLWVTGIRLLVRSIGVSQESWH